MKRIIHMLFLTALMVATQSAWSIVHDRYGWMPSPQVETPFPADAEGGFNLPPLDTYADQDKVNKELQTGNPFPANLAGVTIDD
jgi:hypothetical protein